MDDDIVDRLYEYGLQYNPIFEAATEIDLLRHQVDRLNAALDDIIHLTDERQVHHRIKEARRD